MMPKIVERLTRQLAARGVSNAHDEAVKKLQGYGILKPGSATELTPHGEKRNAMSPEERAIDRAQKTAGGRHKKRDYSYDPATNRATLKR